MVCNYNYNGVCLYSFTTYGKHVCNFLLSSYMWTLSIKMKCLLCKMFRDITFVMELFLKRTTMNHGNKKLNWFPLRLQYFQNVCIDIAKYRTRSSLRNSEWSFTIYNYLRLYLWSNQTFLASNTFSVVLIYKQVGK